MRNRSEDSNENSRRRGRDDEPNITSVVGSNPDSPLSIALQELLSAINGNSLQAGYRSRNLRQRGRSGSTRRIRKKMMLPKDKSLAIISSSFRNLSSRSTTEYTLHFDVIKSDGGEHNHIYSINNILSEDSGVYSSQKKQNVNVLLKFNPGITGVADPSCVITKATAQSPFEGFTAPCTEIILFLSHKAIQIEDMEKYDDISYEEYRQCVKEPEKHPWRVKDLPVDSYIILDKDKNYVKTQTIPFRMARYIGLKLIRSQGDLGNIDFQYFSVKGFSGPRSFSKADIC
ncbi:hypothetical protein K502DRAFT_366134 [Neoconidiobolus thromboides FSU 785]|nr:hypothetical protein K502DRAFT_366134 [Neoconidiobolus thromboides FSU 785]